MDDAAELLDCAGKTAKPVPGRILWPMLESGSLEDESDELRRKWVQLLANAADTDIDAIPTFVPNILAQLDPIEARILDYIYANGDETQGIWECDPEKLAEGLGVQRHELTVSIQNLTRLGLLSEPLGLIPRVDSSKGRQRNTGEYYGTTYLTSLGYTFIACCTFETETKEEG